MKFEPLFSKVLLRRAKPPAQVGSIHVPDTAQQAPTEGEVVACGPGTLMADGSMRPVCVKPGDRVMFGRYAGAVIEVKGEPLVLLDEAEILGVLVEDDEPATVVQAEAAVA